MLIATKGRLGAEVEIQASRSRWGRSDGAQSYAHSLLGGHGKIVFVIMQLLVEIIA